MLKIWGRISSINVRKVVWTAQELGLAFQRFDAGGAFGIVKEPGYLRMNPNAQVPVLDEEGFVLWESNVVVRYLCAKHAAGTFYPLDLAQRFKAEQWMDWQQTSFNPAARNGFIQWIRTPPAQRQPGLIAQSNAAAEPLLDLLDAHLANQPFMGGAHFGMADIPVGCEMHRWFGLPQPRTPRPHLDAWYDRMLARPASAGVLDQPLA
jgi:glutathione S-transferase